MKKSNLLLVMVLLTLPLFAAVTTEKKIKESEETLKEKKDQQKEMSEQLDKIAKDIKIAKKSNKRLNKNLEVLSRQYRANEKDYKEFKKTLSKYDQGVELISTKIKEKNKHFIDTLANQSSVIYAMTQSHDPSRESIVMQEAYKLLKEQNTKELIALKDQIEETTRLKKKIIKKRSRLKKKIDKISKQRSEYKNEKSTKQKLLKKLSSSEKKYRSKLQKTMDEQSALRSALADLNILHKQEVEEERRIAAEQKAAMLEEARQKGEARRRREEARAEARKRGQKVVYETKAQDSYTKPSVKKRGSSYQKNKLYAYRGRKTISPIKGAKVVKNFGTYVDPIYKIKIFNSSITLRAPSSNAKVQNVLNGKVVYAGTSPMLGKVVVVSHSGKMHTVYAGLSKIAPNLRKGSTIKKGYVVGKVSRKLIFEATKESKHINPLRLIVI